MIGQAPIPDCLKTDEVLSQFGVRRSLARDKYREYVTEAIGATPIWEDLKGQSILGTEGFAAALTDHLTGKNTVEEIPKEQRLLGRPSLKKLFGQSDREKVKRNQLIADAVYQHGYSQIEVAKHLSLHYSTISRLINNPRQQK
jgi:hypothetical protein